MEFITERRKGLWVEAFAIHGSITPHVLPHVLIFGVIAAFLVWLATVSERTLGFRIQLQVAPYEIAGAALGLLLVLRTNAGYDRWWEARRMWGGIVNQCRNLTIATLAYGPADREWRKKMIAWTATFPHVARASLRGQLPGAEVEALVGPEEAKGIVNSGHMPSFVALVLADLLREARDRHQLDAFAFLQADRERAQLMDHLGACERILKTPLPRVYSIKIRRFITLFLFTLPVALLFQMQNDFLIPLIVMMVAYPLVSLDQIGVELQNPFDPVRLSHLPLGEITHNLEKGLLGTAAAAESLPQSLRSWRDTVAP
jgi:putative membrane protein